MSPLTAIKLIELREALRSKGMDVDHFSDEALLDYILGLSSDCRDALQRLLPLLEAMLQRKNTEAQKSHGYSLN